MYRHCNMCNILIYFCNISIYFCNTDMNHLQHTSKTSETYVCNMRFQCNISLLLGNGGSLSVEFTGVELASGPKLATPVEKASGSLRWRRQTAHWKRLRWAGGAMEREEDGRPRWGAVEMPAGTRTPWWCGGAQSLRCGGEHSREDKWARYFWTRRRSGQNNTTLRRWTAVTAHSVFSYTCTTWIAFSEMHMATGVSPLSETTRAAGLQGFPCLCAKNVFLTQCRRMIFTCGTSFFLKKTKPICVMADF
jgi:hypothetical protein